jgi:hypothetical protein
MMSWVAQIALQRVADIGAELLERGTREAELLAQLVLLLLGDAGIAGRHHVHRIARDHLDDERDHQHHERDDDGGVDQPFDEEQGHEAIRRGSGRQPVAAADQGIVLPNVRFRAISPGGDGSPRR